MPKDRPFTQALLAQTQALRCAELPADVRERARQCVLDWLGVALAGADSHLVRLLGAHALAEGGQPVATLLGQLRRVSPTQAALVNGAASHVLDYDDVNTAMHGHPTAPILPAAMALAQQLGVRGDRLLAAFVAGYEFACRAGRTVGPGHYERGYHATASIGVLGAAAACAHLLELDAARAAHAIGIAATQAAGLRAMFGTECKPLHVGLAAQNGLRAALWAAAGLVARADALEARCGFADTLAPAFDAQAGLEEPARFHLRDNLFKYHASCYGTHAAIECIRTLRETQGLLPEQVECVVVRGERGQDTICNIAAPCTALEAKFSLRFMAAAALAGADTADLGFYTDARTADPVLCALRDKVRVELMDGEWPMVQGEVFVTLKDGRVLRALHDAAVPDPDLARQGRRLAAKFERLVTPALGAVRVSRLVAGIEALEHQPVDALLQTCTP